MAHKFNVTTVMADGILDGPMVWGEGGDGIKLVYVVYEKTLYN